MSLQQWATSPPAAGADGTPSVSTADDASKPAITGASPALSPSAAPLEPLLDGWSEHLDITTDRPMWYNSKTRATSWFRPTASNPPTVKGEWMEMWYVPVLRYNWRFPRDEVGVDVLTTWISHRFLARRVVHFFVAVFYGTFSHSVDLRDLLCAPQCYFVIFCKICPCCLVLSRDVPLVEVDSALFWYPVGDERVSIRNSPCIVKDVCMLMVCAWTLVASAPPVAAVFAIELIPKLDLCTLALAA